MSKVEKEIKVLDIDIEKIKKKLESLGARLKSDGIQKIYVYDLPSIYSRFYDCSMQLDKCLTPYDLEICKHKLKIVFLEIDNLINEKQKDILFNSTEYTRFDDILSISDTDKLKDILSKEEVVKE